MPTHDLARPLLNQPTGHPTLVLSRPTMKTLCYCLCLTTLSRLVISAPASGFAFPDDGRREKKLEPIITPPVLPVLEHLERDPSTLLPNETGPGFRHAGNPQRRPVKPRFGSGFSVEPSGNGGLTASVSSGGSVGGASHSASQSFSFGFNNGFSGSQSASQSASFGGFGNGFSGSQSSSQAAAFGGSGVSGSASQAAAFAGNGGSGSQSASSAFGFNSLGGFPSQPELNFGEGVLDARQHRGVPGFPFPGFQGRSKVVGAAAFRSGQDLKPRSRDDWLAVVVRDN